MTEDDRVKHAKLAFERNQRARTLLKNIGINPPAIESEKQLLAELLAAEAAQAETENEGPVDEGVGAENEESVDEGAGAAQTAEGIQVPFFDSVSAPSTEIDAASAGSLSDNEPPEDMLRRDETPEDQADETAQTEDGVQVSTVFSGITAVPDTAMSAASAGSLSDDEELELLIKKDEAYARTEERLLADAQMYLMRALNRRCTQFNCFIDLNKPGFAIHLRFFGEVEAEGEKRTRTEFHVLDNYDDAYKVLGIPLTMENAVDLKIAVQSLILNTEGIVPAYNISAGGNSTVARDTQMPLPMLDCSIAKDSSGMCAFVYTAQDPYTKELIYPRIPLGCAVHYENDDAEQRELEERRDFLLNYLQKIEKYRTPEGYQAHVYKRDVMAIFQSWLDANDKEWETAERIALPGFEKGILMHVFSQSNQKITLAPVSLAMDVGGENPSWHCTLPFYIGDKDQKPMGELARTRSLYLRTRNQKLAIARTLESLLGVRDRVIGLLPALQEHMRATGNEWRVEKGDKGDEVFIGGIKLQDFLNDMKGYEDDIGVKLEKREENANGDIAITLQALRCLNGDSGGTVKPAPEYVYEKQGDTRKPIAFTVPVPRDKENLIDAFVERVHSDVNWHAAEAYSSLALGKSEQEDKRKKPLEYRTVQIRNALIRAVEAMYESHFGRKLSKNWHTPENQTAFSSGPVQSNLSTCQIG